METSKKTKIIKCISCDKSFEVKKNSPNRLKCKQCQRTCLQCGQHICSEPEICKRYRVFETLSKYLSFDLSTKGTIGIYSEFERCKDILTKDYQSGLSLEDISNKYGFPGGANLAKIFNSLGILKRSFSSAHKNAYFRGKGLKRGRSRYKHGWHTSWDNKNVYLRSSYEFECAEELDRQKIDYEVESLRIKYLDSETQQIRTAIPDFFIPELNLIIEVKSSYGYNKDKQNVNNKLSEYKELGYNTLLLLEEGAENRKF